MKARVFSGVQPTGNLHIGNYLGALKNWVEIQGNYESIFGIVDLHAITIYQEPAELRAKILETAALFLAAGIDPKQSTIMVQSSVPEHAELAWMLTCVTPVGWLERMTQYKAKSAAQRAFSLTPQPLGAGGGKLGGVIVGVGDGLLQYPVLMTADVLVYQAAIVPVGDDQAQHLELARDIAQRFNSLYGETFVMPATSLPLTGARVMGLDDPTKKMSKSAPGSGHAVALLDPPDVARKKIMRATTDSQPHVDYETLTLGVFNLIDIGRAFMGWGPQQAQAEFDGLRYGEMKKKVADIVISHLEPIQKRYAEIMNEPGYLAGILREGAERVSPIAKSTVQLVKERMGLY
jgi:tryptophanyl-tRNA synthetase